MLKRLYVVPTIILFSLTRLPVKLLFKIFCRLEIKGQENIANLPRGVIFASNHTSELDPIIMTLIFPCFSRHLPLFFTSREKSFYTDSGWRKLIYGGLFFRAWGAYPVKVGLNDYEKSLKNHIEILEDKHSVCIFPEGVRSKDGNIGDAKGGAAYLAYRTKSPIVPVAIKGVLKMSCTDFLLFRRKIKIIIGQPLYPKDIFDNPERVSMIPYNDECKTGSCLVMGKVKSLSVDVFM